MRAFRYVFVLAVVSFLLFHTGKLKAGSNSPMGVLTQAIAAHLNEAAAFPGLSFFEGETLSTETGGKMTARVGGSLFTLGGDSKVTLHRIEHGSHADLDAGSVYFSAGENVEVQIHAHGAIVKPANSVPTQAEVMIWKPRVLQITAKRGDLAFTYGQEFQVLPEGETYRIYLGDDDGREEIAAGGGSSRIWGASKIGYFIVGGAVAGVAGWRIYDIINSQSGMESPAKP
jgi:hypothetical protein